MLLKNDLSHINVFNGKESEYLVINIFTESDEIK